MNAIIYTKEIIAVAAILQEIWQNKQDMKAALINRASINTFRAN